MTSIRGIGVNLKTSLWFLPAICVVLATGIAVGLVELDSQLKIGFAQFWPQLFGLSAEGSRSILAAIAQSVITIAGVTFSITIVALSIAANQYTPRVLRNFMRDRGNQTVLGGLVGIFTYCIIVLRTIHGGERPFIPTISVLAALLLAVAAIGLFIYFIHHVATSIQASTIICAIATETKRTIQTLFPEEVGQSLSERALSPEEERVLTQTRWHAVPAEESGYLQSVDPGSLEAFARKHQAIVRMECAIGDFVLETGPLVSIASKQQPHRHMVRELNNLFSIQSYRTVDQDPAFGIRQIVDIAVKALSPAINDPATATTCLDYLASILSLLVKRHIPSRCRYQSGVLRVVMQWPSFESLLHLAFSEIRQNSASQPAVILSLLRAIERVAQTRPMIMERLQCLRNHAQLALEMAEHHIGFPPDLESIRSQTARLETLFGD